MFEVSRTDQSVNENCEIVEDVSGLSCSPGEEQIDVLTQLELSEEEKRQIMSKPQGLLIIKELIADIEVLKNRGFKSKQIYRIANHYTGVENLACVTNNIIRLTSLGFSVKQIVRIAAQECGYCCLERVLNNEKLLFQVNKHEPSYISRICTNNGKFTRLIQCLERRERSELPDENTCPPQKRVCTGLAFDEKDEEGVLLLYNMSIAASSQTGIGHKFFSPVPAGVPPSHTGNQTEYTF